MVSVFASPDYRVFVLTILWMTITGVCVWWPIASFDMPGFAWNEWLVHVGGVQLDFSFYLPWTVCVCLVMWLGFEWAAFTAYLATLFSTLHKHMPLDLALVNALHNPLAMGVFFLFYCNYSGDYSLRSARSWAWFSLATLSASLMSSFGAFISQFTNTPIGAQGFLSAWLGWWPNAFVQTLLTSGPLILVFTPPVERLKQRYLPRAGGKTFSQQELLMAACMFALMLVLLILVSDQWQANRTQALLNIAMPQAARTNILNQLAMQRFLAWMPSLVLAGVSLGGVFFTGRWVMRLRSRYDSETREARDAQRRSESNFRNFFENNPAPMLLYDRDSGDFVDVNRAAVERYGYTRAEFLELDIFDIRPKEDVAKLKAYRKEMTNPDMNYRQAGEWRHLTKDGEMMHVDVRLNSMVVDNRILNLALIHDISPRKQAQAAVERRARELQQLAAASLQIAGAQAVQEVMQIAADRARELSGTQLALSHCRPREDGSPTRMALSLTEKYAAWRGTTTLPDVVYRMLREKQYPIRLSAAEMQSHPSIFGSPEDTRRQPPLQDLLAVPLTSQGAEVIGALLVSDKGGQELDAEDEAILVQLAQIASVGIESVRLKQVLQQHMEELEQRVTARTAELDESNRELDAFAYSVAHDLRAPLRAMHGFADAVLEDYGGKLETDGRDYLGRIIKAAKSMDTLIQDLLAYSRVGRSKMQLEAVPLAELVQETLAELHHEIAVSSAEVEDAVPPLTVLAYRVTLKQVLLNLVSNALKFVAPGKVPHVRIWAVARQGMVEVCVRDNGIGIAPEHRERIFNVFERLHGAESYPGTGIGLSIVKKGLARMHGEVRVESDGNGTTFHARLKEFRNG